MLAVEAQQIERHETWFAFARSNSRNCGLPRRSRQTISPSSTAERELSVRASDPLRFGKDLKSFPLRETSLHRSLSRYANARNPSHFSSKSRSACENGLRARVSGRGWRIGGTCASIAALRLPLSRIGCFSASLMEHSSSSAFRMHLDRRG